MLDLSKSYDEKEFNISNKILPEDFVYNKTKIK